MSTDSDLSKVKGEEAKVKSDRVKSEETLKIKKEDSAFCEGGDLGLGGDKECGSYGDDEENDGLYFM